MRTRSRRRNLVVWNTSPGAADRYDAPGFTPITRPKRIRWWLRTGALLSVLGIRQLARMVRCRWRSIFIATGALLMVVGFELSSAPVFVPGLLVLLFALLRSDGASHCQAADQLTAARWRG
jgi:hypothetical protein